MKLYFVQIQNSIPDLQPLKESSQFFYSLTYINFEK